ncbi:MAG: ATP-binding cassette domain-containing protein [Clostridia bacterium]|nr:ATP-binding cassette domain-containing protein [Clostridia bacterium]
MGKKKEKNPHPPKPEKGRFPKALMVELDKAGLDTKDLIFCCTGDMDNEACYCSAWLSFDKKGLYIALGEEEEIKTKRKNKRERPEPKFTVNKIQSIPIDDIDSLETERYVSTGRLIMKKGGEQISLIRFSVGKLAQFNNFTRAFNSFKDKGEAELPSSPEPDEHKCKKCGKLCPPGKDFCPKCNKKSSTALRLFKFFGGYIPQIILIIAIMLAGSAVNVFIPQISTRSLFDDVLANPNGLAAAELLKALGVLVLSIFGVRLLNTLLTVIQQYVTAAIMPKVVYDIKVKIFNAMQRLSVNFYSSKQTGSLMERVVRDANNIYWFFIDGVPALIIDTATVIGVVAIMFAMSWKLSLITIAAMPILFVGLFFGDKVFRRLHHRSWLYGARVSAMVSDNINGQRVIKAFAKEDDEFERFSKVSGDHTKADLKLSLTEATVFPILEIFVMGLSTVVLGFGGVMVARGEMTTGTLLSYIVYLEMLRGPFDFLSWISNWWARCADSAQRVFEICDAKPDITEKENAVSFDNLRGDIEINELEFEYEPARPVIKKLSLNVKAGDMLGIVGKTGAGKTTIANLIARLYDAKEGNVKIDGIDVKDLKLAELRRNIGLVSQDIYLFIGSIADNIRYAKPDATMDEVIAAAKAASAHDFIMKLPDAYETRVGAGGQKLSGGERQRISIARTIIQNPKILILDEATAAMDTETERNIQHSLTELKEGRTTIAIAHRLSTLRDADYLAVIEDGKIIEYGTFPELIKQKGEFYKQYKIQSEALKTIGIGTGIPADSKEDEQE